MRQQAIFAIRCLFSALALCTASLAEAGTTLLQDTGGEYALHVKSMKEMRFQTVVKQEHDFSCGSAALATLLTYNYERPTSEADTFQAMYKLGDQSKIRKEGFSMLDMKNYLENHGYHANGYRVSLDKLRKVGVPAIALIDISGYKHFVVIKGITDNNVLLGDPASGLKRMPRSEFEAMWNGILFVILGAQHDRVAHKTFNQENAWAGIQSAPLGLALNRDALSSFTLLLPGRNDL